MLRDWLAKLAPLPQPMGSKIKPNQSFLTRTHFPALGAGDMYLPSNSDWFIALFGSVEGSVVIGQSNYFGFGFITLAENCSNRFSSPPGVYNMALSERLGRTVSKEQYAFLYR